jgi:hypothetical protein
VRILVLVVRIVVLVVLLVVEVVVKVKTSRKDPRDPRKETRPLFLRCHEPGSDAGFAFSRFGGGYVDQKCRPQRGQTQN